MSQFFISYASDNEDFALWLADELEASSLSVWIAPRDEEAGKDFGIQISAAIEDCDAMLFVWSAASAARKSAWCARELAAAVDCGKDIVPLRLERDVTPPIQVRGVHYIDFTDDFRTAVAQLRRRLRDYAPGPPLPPSGRTPPRTVNAPPLVAPDYFQDRTSQTAAIADFIEAEAPRLLAVIGRAGSGKTAMVCRLLRGLERRDPPDDIADPGVDGIVYLAAAKYGPPVSLATLFEGLSGLLPHDEAARLERFYESPEVGAGEQMCELLRRFKDRKAVVFLDGFEELMDTRGNIEEEELAEAVTAVLEAEPHGVKLIVTTERGPALPVNLVINDRVRMLSLDLGLLGPECVRTLRELDRDDSAGLQSATDEELQEICRRTAGNPRALEAVYAVLATDLDTGLGDLLAAPSLLPNEEIDVLFGRAFRKLDPDAQRVMQALAVFRVPVTPSAIDHLLAPHAQETGSDGILARLVNLRLARKEGGRYYLHHADRDYALRLLPEEPAGPGSFTRRSLAARGADYFAQIGLAEQQWKSLDDLAPQLAEFDLRLAAGDFDAAAGTLEVIASRCQQWGHARLVTDLAGRVAGKAPNPGANVASYFYQSQAHGWLGQVAAAIDDLERALGILAEHPNTILEGRIRGNLGALYAQAHEHQRSIDLTTEALEMARATGDRQVEATWMMNLANRRLQAGETAQAVDQYLDAQHVAEETGAVSAQCEIHVNLGLARFYLDDIPASLGHYDAALAIAREHGLESGALQARVGRSQALLAAGDPSALDEARRATNEAARLVHRRTQTEGRMVETQALLEAGEYAGAQEAARAALDLEEKASVRAALGITALRIGRPAATEATSHFEAAVRVADQRLAERPGNHAALDQRGIALAGLAICEGSQDRVEEALASFVAARAINRDPGYLREVRRELEAMAESTGGQLIEEIQRAAGAW